MTRTRGRARTGLTWAISLSTRRTLPFRMGDAKRDARSAAKEYVCTTARSVVGHGRRESRQRAGELEEVAVWRALTRGARDILARAAGDFLEIGERQQVRERV